MSHYSNGKIYTIPCKTNPHQIYVGSAVKTLSFRFACHKADCLKKTQ